MEDANFWFIILVVLNAADHALVVTAHIKSWGGVTKLGTVEQKTEYSENAICFCES